MTLVMAGTGLSFGSIALAFNGHYGAALSTFMGWYHAGIFPAEIAVGKTYRFDADQVDAGLKRHARKKAKFSALA